MKKRTLSRLLAAFLAVMLLAQSLCLTALAEETTPEATPEAVTETEPETEPVNEAVMEEPKVEEPKVEEPKVEEPEVEEPKVEEPEVEEPEVEEPEVEEPEVEEPEVEEPEVEEPVVVEPVDEEPEVEEPEVKAVATQVLIPAGSDAAAVNSILTKALLGEDAASDTKWEYECIGYSKLLKNTAWGSIKGFTSEIITTVIGIKHTTTYTHPALANNEDGIYQVRVVGTTKAFTIHKLAKLQSSIALKQDVSLSMCYGQDGAPDIAATKAAIFDAVVASYTPAELPAADVAIEYSATATTGLVENWAPLEGGKVGILTYPAIGLGKQKIRISWDGNEEYGGFSEETTITLNERSAPEYTLNESPSIKLVYNDDLTVNYADIESTVFDAIVDSAPFTASDVSIEYHAKATTGSFGNAGKKWVPLTGGKVSGLTYPAIGEGTWRVRISWGGSQSYAPVTIEASLTVVDGRIDSQIALKSDASFTYNMDVDTMKQAVLDNVIDWNASTLPAKDTLSLEDFTLEYKASPSILDDVNSDKRPKEYVPFEGGKIIISYPSIGAGVQSIRVTYKGSAEYKPSQPTEGSITINKAKVKVHVKSASMYVSEAKNGLNLVTTTPDDHFNTFVVYAGVTRNVTSAVYLQLPESYTSNQVLIQFLDEALKKLKQPTITEMLQNGITVGKLRQLLKTQGIVALLEKIGIDTGALGQLIKVIDKLPAVADDLCIAVGVPNHAGAYSVTAITNNKNYNVGVGVGALVLKADKAKLVWKQVIGKKISATDAKTANFTAELQMNGEAVPDQPGVHSVRVLYSGLTSKWKVYSSTTTPPTEPGRYVMTVVVLGGDYQAAPITRSFQITK